MQGAIVAGFLSKFGKIAFRAVIIGASVTAILVLLNTITIPTPDFSPLVTGIETGLALIYHWCPGSSVFIPVAVDVLGICLLLIGLEILIIVGNFIASAVGND